MKTKKNILFSGTIISIIILLCSVISWRLSVDPSRATFHLRKAISSIFPHELFVDLRVFILGQFFLERPSQLQWFLLPLFSILFGVFLTYSLAQFRNYDNKRPLQIACFIFIGSILISVLQSVKYYSHALKAYKNSRPSEGIIGLIDSFALPRPSLGLLLLEVGILAVYVAWGIWVILQLRKINP